MYRDSSNVSGDLSEALVFADLIRRGWIVLSPSSRDSVYDFVVDLGDNNFQTVQVKTMCGNSIAKVIDRSGERVSANGKTRNSLDYAEHGVHWLAGVRKSDGAVFYYALETYREIPTKSFSVNKWEPDEFPVNDVPTRHALKTEKSDLSS
tara:strand:+ start:155 stop:604 length:450 start_codon:yes stop_codon:yes gene_type:complete